VYTPPRPLPICTSHGQTAAGGASIVITRVDTMPASASSSSPGSFLDTSSRRAPQVRHQFRKKRG